MHATILFNPHSGKPTTRSTSKEFEALRRGFQRHGVTTRIVKPLGDRLQAAIQECLETRPDRLVVAGGDGTLNAAASATIDAQIPLAILPFGTMNHFARDAGVPNHAPAAIRLAAKGRPRNVDVGEVNGRIFLNNSSIGVYPRFVHDRQELRDRHGHGKFMATARAGLSVLRRHPTLRVQVKTGAERVEHETPFVFVGNNPYDLNFFILGRRRRLDTGRLSIYYSLHAGRTASVRLALRSLVGNLDPDRDFRSHDARALTLQSRRSSLRVAYDGEIRRLEPPLRYHSRAGALPIIGGPPKRWRRPA